MATSVQTSYGATPAIGIAGQLADHPTRVVTKTNSSASTIIPGVVCLRSGDGTCVPILTADTPALDIDSIATVIATASTPVLATGAALDGLLGVTVFTPRNIVLTLNSHSDWNASTILVRGLRHGLPVTEAFEVPEGGNVTLTGVEIFTQVTEVYIPIQTSTNGTLDVGTGVAIGPIDHLVAGISLYDATREPGAYARYEEVPLLRQGRVYALAEAAVTEGNPVYVRFVVAAAEIYGEMRATADANDCGLLVGARWVTSTTGAGIAVVEINLP